MAATLHAKINRKRLDKLDIIKICEEILNPSVPMALRLSGILMGGVVIVYERKVKLLYDSHRFQLFLADDVSRLLIEINEAWKIRPAVDHTVLPKGKAQAKYEAVTLPENAMDMEVEQPVLFTDTDTARFRGMRLEDLDEQYVNVNLDDDDISRADRHHQAEAVNITLVDNFESGLAETDIFNRFERFDIADDDTTVHITLDEHPEAPSTLVPSPPRPEDPPQQQEQCAAPSPIREEPQQGEIKHMTSIFDDATKLYHWTQFSYSYTIGQVSSAGDSLKEQEEQKTTEQQPTKRAKRKARGNGPQVIMDNQIMIPGNVYQSWLKDPSSLISKRRQVRSKINPIKAIKIGELMDLPPSALMSCSDDSQEIYYPQQLMQLWKECTKVKPPKPSSSSGDKSSSSSQEKQPRNSPPQPQGDQNEMGAQPMDFTDGIEKIRANKSGEFEGVFDGPHGDPSVTPGSPGLSRRSASSSGGSGRGGFLPLDPEILLQSGSGRAKRRQLSSGRSLGNLDPVEEEFPMEQEGRECKLRRLSDIEPTPDLMVETEPTQTPFTKQSSPPDHITESIHSYLKLHFESPDAPPSESLSQLTYGMNTAQAARLFYQTCVLATLDSIKVTQVPVGDRPPLFAPKNKGACFSVQAVVVALSSGFAYREKTRFFYVLELGTGMSKAESMGLSHTPIAVDGVRTRNGGISGTWNLQQRISVEATTRRLMNRKEFFGSGRNYGDKNGGIIQRKVLCWGKWGFSKAGEAREVGELVRHRILFGNKRHISVS
ncbi:Sister chromatid cohesion 1 protein 1 [Triticum urartu]|uniref:Sister chromatid cohesion 1 protein 1 n=1 Tax=Triticum urartu TaxID=4572 RepID=M8APB3_TRIUA|nr:Sister chromatid cohesion 1 protein 1 [Triticum urartu]